MSKSERWFSRKWWHVSLGAWAFMFGAMLLTAVVFGLFFVKRKVLEFLPEHTFAVRSPAFFGSAHAMADPIPIDGNKIDLLNNGDEIFPAMLGAIKGARKSVNFEAFLFHSGSVGTLFRDAFMERARAGVIVRVLLDGIGSGTRLDNADVEAMKQAGVRFAYYHPVRAWRVDRVNRRTHRRILVVDGRVGFTGGVGFADEWQGHAETKNHWRDLHARIEGPLVARLQGAFQQHWAKEAQEALSGADEFPELQPVGKLRAQLVESQAFSIAPLPLVQATAIAAAERRISITNAYCMPNDDQVALLTQAVKRGVDVRVLLPGKHNDQPLTKAAGRTAYGKLLEGGVKIYEFEPTMIHSKTMVVDAHFAMFGSSNLDSRSSQINEELDVTVCDDGFGAEMERVFDADLKRSRPYTLEQFKKRTLKERAGEWLSVPFRSQLTIPVLAIGQR